MKKVLFIILISCFSLTIISCSEEKEEYSATGTTDNTTTTDTTAPTVSSTSPSDSGTFVAVNSSISATFSDVMDTTTITTNTSNTTCSGTFQVSSDSFSNCFQMSSSPSASNSDKTFTVTPSSNISYTTSYKIRVTTGVKDIAGNNLESNYTSSTGFETVSFISHWGDNGSTTGYHSPDSLACDNMANGSGKTCPANGTQYIGQAFQLSSTKSIKYIGLGLCAVGLNSCTDSYLPYSISVYNDNSSKPGSVLNSYTSFLKDDSNFTTMYDGNNTAYGVDYSCVIDFGSTKKEFSANTKYWIVAYFSNSAWCPNLSEEATPKVSTMMQSSDGATWSVLDNLTSSNFGSTKHRAIRLWLAE